MLEADDRGDVIRIAEPEVKIRGVRVEPEEVEAQLVAYVPPASADCGAPPDRLWNGHLLPA